VHIVRGDLFRLPFANETFDRIFSIGVLMHTGNAGAAFDSISRTLRHNGLITTRVYGQGLFVYEILDALIRTWTTRLSLRRQMDFARFTAATARWLREGKGRAQLHRRILFKLVNLLPTEHHMFDWWAAPIATHHTQKEVLCWFTRNQLQVLRAKPLLDDQAAEEFVKSSQRRLRHSRYALELL